MTTPARPLLLLLVAATPLAAQIKPSEAASVSQTVAGTRLALEYSRPSARGRTALFGGEVKWEEVWTPGANWATTLETDHDVTLEGKPLPKGKYSLWMVVKEQGDWQLLVAKESHLFHLNRPKPEQELFRVPVTPSWNGPFVETLAWDFPVVKPDRAVMRLQWGTLTVPVHVDVPVPPEAVASAEERRRYVGTYALEKGGAARAGQWAPEKGTLTVFEEGGRLRARLAPAPPGHDAEVDLLQVMSGWFVPVYYSHGARQGAEGDLVFGFTVEDGKVTKFELNDATNRTILKGGAPK